ncbi:MAG TPA: twitching motility protein PilT [Micromonosporaceae bacterium]|nr:twitching motility protein PilT [Micromonosporaceae bacterium]HCU51548.1 twitching motility protein PilT [Micromonosporaceae bacterium]
MNGFTYDAGALIAAERNDRRMWLIHQRALARGDAPIVPAAILTEVYRGKNAQLDRFLEGCKVEVLTEVLARAAGMMLAECKVDTGAVDAIVVENALRRGNAVVTSNVKHLAALAEGVGRKLEIVPV